MAEYDVVVVGAGPAGRAAALECTRAGARVAVVDEHSGDGSAFAGFTVWDLWGRQTKTLSLYRSAAGVRQLRARMVILAPGERAKHRPFPGWTLPGVENLNEAMPVDARGRRVVLAGTSPNLLSRVEWLLEHDAHLVAVADASARSPLASIAAMALLGMNPPVLTFVRAYARAQTHRVLWLRNSALAEVAGPGHVEAVALRTLRDAHRTRRFDVDRLYVDWGRTPATELAFGMGAAWRFDARLGTFVARRDRRLQLSVPGVFLAGAAGGQAQGSTWAAREGTVAGTWAAVDLGLVSDATARARLRPIQRSLRRWRRLAEWIEGSRTLKAEPLASATPGTIICRCEGVTFGDLKEHLFPDVTDPNWIKGPTNAAMGRCLGRDCETNVALSVACLRGDPAETSRPLNVRPPFRPVPLGCVAEDTPVPNHIQRIHGT